MTETVGAWGDGGQPSPPPAVSSSLEAPLAGTEAGEPASRGSSKPQSAAVVAEIPVRLDPGSPSSPAASTAWSRVITVGVNSCDGYPRCSFEGTGRDLKLHKRECPFSDAGAMYRVFRGAGYR